jgi:hypothetical protein
LLQIDAALKDAPHRTPATRIYAGQDMQQFHLTHMLRFTGYLTSTSGIPSLPMREKQVKVNDIIVDHPHAACRHLTLISLALKPCEG